MNYKNLERVFLFFVFFLNMGNHPTMEEINLWLTWSLQYFFFCKSSLYYTCTISLLISLPFFSFPLNWILNISHCDITFTLLS